MGWKDALKLVVGIPPGAKSLGKHGSVAVPGEDVVELPAGKVKLTYAESIRPAREGKSIAFSKPDEVTVALRSADGTAVEMLPPRMRSAGSAPGPLAYSTFGVVELAAAGAYTVSATAAPANAVEPRILLG